MPDNSGTRAAISLTGERSGGTDAQEGPAIQERCADRDGAPVPVRKARTARAPASVPGAPPGKTGVRAQDQQESPEDLTLTQWDRTFRTNIYGYFYMVKAALPYLHEGCAIINTGSITGLEGSRQLLDYASTKGAIHAFTKSLAQNLVERKIRVNCVSPGPVWTPLNTTDKEPEQVATFGMDTPMKRPAQPEEIAPAYVVFA